MTSMFSGMEDQSLMTEFSAGAWVCLFGRSQNWTASPYARHNRFETFSSSMYLVLDTVPTRTYWWKLTLYSLIPTVIAVQANTNT